MATVIGIVVTHEANHHTPGKPSVYVCPSIKEAQELLRGIIDNLGNSGSCTITVRFGVMILEEVGETKE